MASAQALPGLSSAVRPQATSPLCESVDEAHTQSRLASTQHSARLGVCAPQRRLAAHADSDGARRAGATWQLPPAHVENAVHVHVHLGFHKVPFYQARDLAVVLLHVRDCRPREGRPQRALRSVSVTCRCGEQHPTLRRPLGVALFLSRAEGLSVGGRCLRGQGGV